MWIYINFYMDIGYDMGGNSSIPKLALQNKLQSKCFQKRQKAINSNKKKRNYLDLGGSV